MFGTAKSFSVERIAPRSSATTFSPASASSLLKIPPVQPSPTTTTSTSFSFVTMTRPRPCRKRVPTLPGHALAHVRDAERIVGGEFLTPVFLHILAMHCDRARKADQLPARLVAVAAVDRGGKQAFDHGLIERGPQQPNRESAVERDRRG